jgi:TRAP-type C4-dicarboxylate transport system substrate-binding protein
MNKAAYDRLDADKQAVLNEAGAAMSDELGRAITADNAAAIETMREEGVEIIELPDEERAKLVEAGSRYIDEWVEQVSGMGLDGAQILETYKTLLEKYADIRDTEGYPWEASDS